ncbi:MAG: B12-binding domain-containing radical SAM protein [Oscillospiraceae bacterium]|nr:B12-binding domain-containing radical SAM protein [Oscillospiraceae bacterium]
MNNKVVLIGFYNEKALGVRYLANALTSHGFEPIIIFFKRFNSEVPEIATEKEVDLARQIIEKSQPIFVGLSVMSSLYLTESDKVNEMVRKNFNVPVVWGGVYATLEPQRALEKCDIVSRGEGEGPIAELAIALRDGTDWKHIRGMCYLDENGNFVQNDIGPIQEDIDLYGYPIIGGDNMYLITDDKIIPGDPQLRAFSYELSASRGCPFQCTYCSAVNLRRVYTGQPGRYVRFRSVDSVIEELKDAKAKIPRLRLVHFWDEIFSNQDGWVDEFSWRYKEEIGLPFRIWGHPLMTNDDIISKLVDAGLHQVVMGIQSGSPTVRAENFHRYEKQEQIIEASRVLSRQKVPEVYYDLMICHPFETLDQLKETFDLCLELEPPFHLNIHGLNFLPATDIVQMAIDRGMYTQEELDSMMYSSLQEQYDRHWGPHASSFADASAKNSWSDLIFLTQFPAIRKEVIALSRDPDGNTKKITALKKRMEKKKRLDYYIERIKLVLKIGS